MFSQDKECNQLRNSFYRTELYFNFEVNILCVCGRSGDFIHARQALYLSRSRIADPKLFSCWMKLVKDNLKSEEIIKFHYLSHRDVVKVTDMNINPILWLCDFRKAMGPLGTSGSSRERGSTKDPCELELEVKFNHMALVQYVQIHLDLISNSAY